MLLSEASSMKIYTGKKKNKLKLYNPKNNFDYHHPNNFDRCMSDIITGYYLKFEVSIKG